MVAFPDPLGSELIARAMRIAREQSGLDLAYVSEFRDGAQFVRCKDGDDSLIALTLDEAIPLEGTYCQRMVDGRIPSVVQDTHANGVTATLPVTEEAHLGAYLGVPVRLPDGRLYGTFCVAASAAHPELGEREHELMSVLAALIGDQIDRAERATAVERGHQEFLASVSHDLRTPLKAISFLAEDLAAGDPAVEPGEAGRLIQQESERLLGMVDDLLTVARQRVGVLELFPRSLDVRDVVRDAVWVSSRAAGDDGQRIVLDLPDEPVEAMIDARRVVQAVSNLVDNALKYSPDGGDVSVGLRIDDTTIVIDVVDSGIGVSQADLVHLGERFFRGTSARHRGIPGIGLGLATAQAVAEAHEGVLSATSVVGEGSSFRLRLPRRRAAAHSAS